MPDRRRLLRSIALAAAAAGAFFLFAAADLALRSRGALQRAERHAAWHEARELKEAHFNALFERGIAAIKKEQAEGLLSAEQAARRAVLAAAERDFLIAESSAKQAYIWYRTAARDFPAPFNPWAARAESRLPSALAAWRAELAAKGIKAEDWMLH